jgi:DNA mismatch repair protein MutS2
MQVLIMDEKTLTTLEFPKILDRLAGYCAFAASEEKARQLRPTNDLWAARRRQSETSEAVRLLTTHAELSVGGARDVRAQVDLARHGGILAPNELLDIKSTLVAARTLSRTFERLEYQYPVLVDILRQLPAPTGLIDSISKALSERGEILDSASEKLGNIRRELRIVHDRLLARLQRMVGDPKNTPYLQEALITQRDGRYVLPLRAEFKGRIRSIVHDQSSSGATLFVEPLVVVEMNNQYRELQLAERDEERRILAELSLHVGGLADEINQVVEVIAVLDLILARARYSDDLRASEPQLVPLEIATSGGQSRLAQSPTIRLYQARHPLLDPATVVPIDFELESGIFALVITGPNTGGKTVALKTVGLLALMALAGLHIPAQSGSEVSVFDKVFADIGDEQSIEQSLSTFSGHITNIIRILERADERSLVILDELGAGTDPQEGAALARSILIHLVDRHCTTLVTTHHPELKSFAHATPGVINASVEFDLETLQPTFHLTIGLPGRSNALAIAQRLGLPEHIIAAARGEINPDDLRAEDLLDEIHHQRDIARKARQEAEITRQQSETLRQELVNRLEKIEDERRKVLENARHEGEQQVESLQVELAEARRMLVRARQPLDALKEVEEKASLLEESVEAPVERHQPELGPALSKLEKERRRSIRLGDKVRVRSLGAQGVVTSLGDEEAEVSVGVLRVRARISDLELPSPSGAVQVPGENAVKVAEISRSQKNDQKSKLSMTVSPGMELDLRGQRADDAIEVLESYLDAAFLAGLPFVRVIHGKGTGKLREVVRKVLKDHPNIKSFEAGGDKEGGEGVTIVKF